ncbi:glycoside hydrolase family 29 [Bacteroides thetaiotaomicron]|uniref:alpha-L-fucosidase n=1 Tax=Bacteroides thetaiotaomicron TaxID=818 RepID=A0A6I0NCW1_BACT4|nr:alpha-L-fucosidase [Bacteroides thetaiotaomicron]UUB87420.1 alpha-L-fucosidase [uncultured Bacteroides sp.]KAB4264829.1 glycoside hydrolase family 29 [Bacteroides thetaiotaomicron]KAB4274516.1 glycoside hydrolase family 29 [Bacteroides thetaiotaomicron]KAB4282353.1 glycoside hydrolase family 29 [Bacteroides thetaiotaomicron]KAB4288130.1 glycoside hydrolase family 29 [Bacteroides thetaiotaomicron]
MKRKPIATSISTVVFSLLLTGCQSVSAPEAILPVPQEKQVNWQKMETYAFVHFGLNTFNDREWGYGDSDPKTFNPARLDCEQWVQTFVNSGMKGVILTAKHHDGFCLWPTQLTEYCIRNTPYKDGKGDIVRELSDACKKYGIKFAVYLSPWDRHQANYGTPEYVDYFYKQLHELLTNYGDVFEIWFDGANGGDGWYGGAKDARTIDRKTYYDYPRAYKMIDELQPQAVIFSDGGPGCRWVGNENGFAGATNWSFLRGGEVYPGYPKYRELQYGHADGNQWVAAECDVSIRPGWFYHPEEDDKVKTVDQLTDLYYRSVGHNATLLLNFPVDRNGLIHPTDSLNAVSFHQRVQKELADNLLSSAKVSASDERGGQFKVRAVTDGKYDTYWATNDGVTTADLTFTFSQPTKMNRVMIQEYIPLGQRVKSFVVEYKKGDQWLSVKCNEETTTVGYKRLLRFEMIETEELRIRFMDARACLCINEVGAYYAPDATENYTPATSELKSFPFTILGVDMEEAKKCSDKDDQTTALISGKEILIDLGENRTIHSFYYLPDQSEYSKGLISSYELSAGITEEAMQVVAQGEFSNIRNNPILQNMYFSPVEARYFKLKATRMVDESDSLGIAEIGCR